MPLLPDLNQFNAYHQERLKEIEFYKELISANHIYAPPVADHIFNLTTLRNQYGLSEESPFTDKERNIYKRDNNPSSDNQFNVASTTESNTVVNKPKLKRGRPIVHMEFAHLKPEERNRKVRAKYQKERRLQKLLEEERANGRS